MTFTILCGVIHVRQGAPCCDSDLRYPVGDISPQRETKEEGLSFEVECVAQRGHVSGEACLHLASVYSHGARSGHLFRSSVARRMISHWPLDLSSRDQGVGSREQPVLGLKTPELVFVLRIWRHPRALWNSRVKSSIYRGS